MRKDVWYVFLLPDTWGYDAPFKFLKKVKAACGSLYLMRNRGGHKESFTKQQLSDYRIERIDCDASTCDN